MTKEDKIKILHVSHSLDTGGGPLYIKKIVQDLPEYSHYVVGNKGYFFEVLLELIGPSRVRLLKGKNLLYNVWTINRLIRSKSITIVHCHGRGAGLYSRLLKLFNWKIKVVYTLHGFHPETVNGLFRRPYIMIERAFAKITDQIILLSQSEYNRFICHVGDFPKKLNLIPNYLRRNEFNPTALDLNLDREFVNLVYVGRFSQEKGIDLAIKAMVLLRKENVRLYLIGYGPMELWISEMIESHDLQRNVFLLGKRNQASQLLTNFDAVLIPSRFEGMPFIVLESMLYKMPIICTPSVGIVDLISNDTAFICNGFNSDDLSNEILNFVNLRKSNKSSIDEMVSLNYSKLLENYSDSNIRKVGAIYEKLNKWD